VKKSRIILAIDHTKT